MTKTFLLIIIVALGSCKLNDTENNQSALSEFNFTNINYKASPGKGSFGLAFTEKDTMQNGDTYRLKLFIENHQNLYSSDSVRPTFRFYEYFTGDSLSWHKLHNSNQVVEGTQDTAFIKFIAKDVNLKKGESRVHTWRGMINIPRPNTYDTVFLVTYEYIIQQK
ncbi:hypothetical protein [Rufibacter hautae]|uniref:Uncharacterized protein n=1 Tax=Rufibacter hautae TaxID=2595005 RepID=A0A5B6TK73_9BACT|nr:hypothetical protein [Rufibacter hautae]KAA3439850.1 hypothetical protein FOA19_04040 [Rufibacter hautae]